MSGHQWPPLPAPTNTKVISQDALFNNTTALSFVSGGGPTPGAPVTTVSAGANLRNVGDNTGNVVLALQSTIAGVSSLSFVANGTISGVSSINNQAYPPPAGSVPANLVASTLQMNPSGWISTTAINGVTTINGSAYPPPAGSVPADLNVSTLNMPSLIYDPGAGKYAGAIYTDTLGILSQTYPSDGPTFRFESQSDASTIIGPGLTSRLTMVGTSGPTLGVCNIESNNTGVGISAYSNYGTPTFDLPISVDASELRILCPLSVSSMTVSSINGIGWARISTVIGEAPA